MRDGSNSVCTSWGTCPGGCALLARHTRWVLVGRSFKCCPGRVCIISLSIADSCCVHDALAYHPHNDHHQQKGGWQQQQRKQGVGFMPVGRGDKGAKHTAQTRRKAGARIQNRDAEEARRKGKKMGARGRAPSESGSLCLRFVSWFPDLKAHKFSRRSLRFFVVVVAFVCLGHIFSMFMSLFPPCFLRC